MAARFASPIVGASSRMRSSYVYWVCRRYHPDCLPFSDQPVGLKVFFPCDLIQSYLGAAPGFVSPHREEQFGFSAQRRTASAQEKCCRIRGARDSSQRDEVG